MSINLQILLLLLLLLLSLEHVFQEIRARRCASYVLHNGASPWTWQVHEKAGRFHQLAPRDEEEGSCFDLFTTEHFYIRLGP